MIAYTEIDNPFSFRCLVSWRGQSPLFDSALSCFIFINIPGYPQALPACGAPLKKSQPTPSRNQGTELMAKGQTGRKIPSSMVMGQVDIFRASSPGAAVLQKPTLQG